MFGVLTLPWFVLVDLAVTGCCPFLCLLASELVSASAAALLKIAACTDAAAAGAVMLDAAACAGAAAQECC